MLLTLHTVSVHLRSPNRIIQNGWRRLFDGWLAARPEPPPEAACFRLTLVPELPPLPSTSPFFSDAAPPTPHSGILNVYDGPDDTVLLHYLDGALITVPLHADAPPHIQGYITPAALEHGRFEDITFTSLAPLLRRRGYYLIHAFAAGKNGRARLIVGPSGSGKTTTGLTLILNGWQLLANDILLLKEERDAVYALPTPGGVNIRPGTLDLLPALRPHLEQAHFANEQYHITSRQLIDGRWSSPAPVTAVYFPHIHPQPTTTRRRQSRALCLARLMTESIDRWDQPALDDHITLLQTLARQAACYTLHLGHDLDRIPPLLQNSDNSS